MRPQPAAGMWEIVKTLAAADVDDLTPTGHLDEVQELWPALCALQAQVARRVGWIHDEGAAALDAAPSTKAWLGTRLRLDALDASRLIQAGTTLAQWTKSLAAFGAGQMSVDHAAAIASAGADLGEKVMANGGEDILLHYATHYPPSEVRKLGRQLKHRYLDEESAADRQERLHDGRWLSAARTFDGAISVKGVLDPDQGETLLAALAAYTAGPDPQKLSGRKPGQRRADALTDICTMALGVADRPDAGGEKPHVTVTVPLSTLLRGLAGHDRDSTDPFAAATDPLWRLGGHQPALLGPDEEPICAATARRLACDAGIIPVVLGSNSEPLDIGRLTRTVPAAMRRALVLRDGGCRFPGCRRGAQFCDAHHLIFWACGGPTTLTNLILLCAYHHRLVHDGRWTVKMDPATATVKAWRPDGKPYDLVSNPRGPTTRR